MLISFSRGCSLVCAVLLLPGCLSSKTPDSRAAAAVAKTAPVKAEATSTPVPALPPEAVSDATLSYLDPDSPERCRWVQHTPPEPSRTLLVLPVSCENSIQVAWSPDGREALVAFETPPHDDQEERQYLWRLELATLRKTELPWPPLGTFALQGFDTGGRPLMLMSDPLLLDEEGRLQAPEDGSAPHITLVTQGKGRKKKRFMLFEGKRYPLEAEEGIAGLAHAFRLEEGAWKRIETASTFYEVDNALGVDALKASQDMGPNSERMRARAWGAALEAVAEGATVLRQLPTTVARPAEQEELGAPTEADWQELKTAHGPVYVNLVGEAEAVSLEAPVYVQGAKGPERLPLPDVEAGQPISVSARGEWLLVTGVWSEAFHARVWNLKTGQPLASVDGKQQLTFWPRPLAAARPAEGLPGAPLSPRP